MISDDNYTPGSAVDSELLLKYLIEKSEELSHGNRPRFSLPFRGLGAVALDPFPELHQQFLTITAKSEESVSKRAEKCKELFVDALARPQDRESKDEGDGGDEDGGEHPSDRVIANRFAWEARRLGESMLERQDFQHIQVWQCMTYIALQSDAEKLKDFQEKCLLYTDPAERIEAVIPILWATMTRKNQAASEQAN